MMYRKVRREFRGTTGGVYTIIKQVIGCHQGWNLFNMKPPFVILLFLNIGVSFYSVKAQFDPLTSDNCQLIQFDSTTLSSAQEYASLTFGSCTFDSTNSSMIGALYNLTDCGGGLISVNSDSNTTYTGTFVLTVQNSTDILPFQSNYEFECIYNKVSDNLTVGFNSSQRQTGHAYANSTVSLDNKFTLTIPKTSYQLGDYIDLKIAFSPSSPNLRMMPQNCYARSVDNAFRYNLLLDRCPSDPGTTIKYTGTLEADVTFEAFRFMNSQGSELYVTCEILVCIGTEARCDNCTSAVSRKRRGILTDSRHLTTIHSNTFYVQQRSYVEIIRIGNTNNNDHTAHARQYDLETLNGLICLVTLCTLLFLIIIGTIKKHYDDQDVKQKQVRVGKMVKKVLPTGVDLIISDI